MRRATQELVPWEWLLSSQKLQFSSCLRPSEAAAFFSQYIVVEKLMHLLAMAYFIGLLARFSPQLKLMGPLRCWIVGTWRRTSLHRRYSGCLEIRDDHDDSKLQEPAYFSGFRVLSQCLESCFNRKP